MSHRCIGSRTSSRSRVLSSRTVHLLAGTSALAICATLGAGQAHAQVNSYVIGGGPAVTFPTNTNPWPVHSAPIVWNIINPQTVGLYDWSQNLAPGAAPVTFNINAAITSAIEGTYTTAWGAVVTNNVNADVTSAAPGIRVWNNFSFITAGGQTVIQGAGNIRSTLAEGILVLSGDAPLIVNLSGNVTGATSGIAAVHLDGATPNPGPMTVTTTGTVTGTSATGINLTTTRGDINVSGGGTGRVIAGDDGVTLISNSGNVSVRNFASINAGDAGIWAPVSGTGNIDIQGNQLINGTARYGILAGGGGGTGNINIGNVVANGNITGGLVGIDAWTIGTGAIDIRAPALTQGTGHSGMFVRTLSGSVTVDGAGTGIARGLVEEGITAFSQTGNTIVRNFAEITGGDTGIWAPTTGAGNIDIQGNGSIRGLGTSGTLVGIGILAGGAGGTGNINIGTTATNGPITGLQSGIDAWTAGTGQVNITTAASVTGTNLWGVLARSANGNITTNFNAGTGTISGGTRGYEAVNLGTGGSTTAIAAGVTVEGGVYGLLTATTTGNAIVNNAGTIKTTGDTGAAGVAGGDAIWNYAGNSIVNNTGQIIGRVHTGTISSILNNNAGGVWTPGTGENLFAGAADAVNNAGVINVRSGDTVFRSLEALRNLSGGTINMRYGSASTDTLTVMNFSPLAGSIINVNVETGVANGAGDSGGQGRGDTIVVTNAATPSAKSTINITAAGPIQTTLTGSIAIVNTSAADVLAPAAGAKLTPSLFYMLGSHNLPGFGTKYVYTLVDDGAGGVFLVWQPNTSAAALGGFGGGVVGGSSAGALAAASGSSAGLGGAGGPPSGGGAMGRIGDIAASAARTTNAECTSQSRFFGRGWAEVAGSRHTGNVTGQSRSLAGGTELQLPTDTCGRHAVGIFGFAGEASTSIGGARDQNDNRGVGGYLRAATSFGLYGSVLGAYNWVDHNVFNPVIRSTAERDEANKTIAGSIGWAAQVMPGTIIDVRGLGRYTTGTGNAFTDSVGITVSGTTDKSNHYGAMVGISQLLAPSLWLDVRGGVVRSHFDSSLTAFGVTQSGSASAVTKSLETGLRGQVGANVEIGASGFGAWTDGMRSLGGQVNASIRF